MVAAAFVFPILDPIVAIAIAVLILKILVDAARHVLRRTMDGVDEELVATAEITLENVPLVGGVHDVRLRWVGHRLWAEVDISVDPELTLGDAHVTAHRAEHALYHWMPQLAAATVHAYPLDAESSEDAHASIRPSPDHHRILSPCRGRDHLANGGNPRDRVSTRPRATVREEGGLRLGRGPSA